MCGNSRELCIDFVEALSNCSHMLRAIFDTQPAHRAAAATTD